MQVNVISGNIAAETSDAIITAINSGGMWFGGIDGVIQRMAGNMFHNQAAAETLTDGKAIVAYGRNSNIPFKNVVFVVDDLKQKLSSILYNGLVAAQKEGFEYISIPAIRTGVMLGVVEKNLTEVADEFCIALNKFKSDFKSSMIINFVIYDNPQFKALLTDKVKSI